MVRNGSYLTVRPSIVQLDLRNDDSPKLNTEDFLCEPGVLCRMRDESFTGEPLVL